MKCRENARIPKLNVEEQSQENEQRITSLSIRNIAHIGLGVVLYIFLISILGIGCPFRFVFHIPCPVCGMTRAILSILHGELGQAFTYHPLVLFIPVWLLVLFGRNTKFARRVGEKLVWAFLYFGGILIFFVYLYRLNYWLII